MSQINCELIVIRDKESISSKSNAVHPNAIIEIKPIDNTQLRVSNNKRIIHYPTDGHATNRKDVRGIDITYDQRKHKISFRDEIERCQECDIYEVEQRKHKKSVCNSCIVI